MKYAHKITLNPLLWVKTQLLKVFSGPNIFTVTKWIRSFKWERCGSDFHFVSTNVNLGIVVLVSENYHNLECVKSMKYTKGTKMPSSFRHQNTFISLKENLHKIWWAHKTLESSLNILSKLHSKKTIQLFYHFKSHKILDFAIFYLSHLW